MPLALDVRATLCGSPWLGTQVAQACALGGGDKGIIGGEPKAGWHIRIGEPGGQGRSKQLLGGGSGAGKEVALPFPITGLGLLGRGDGQAALSLCEAKSGKHAVKGLEGDTEKSTKLFFPAGDDEGNKLAITGSQVCPLGSDLINLKTGHSVLDEEGYLAQAVTDSKARWQRAAEIGIHGNQGRLIDRRRGGGRLASQAAGRQRAIDEGKDTRSARRPITGAKVTVRVPPQPGVDGNLLCKEGLDLTHLGCVFVINLGIDSAGALGVGVLGGPGALVGGGVQSMLHGGLEIGGSGCERAAN